MTSPHVHHQKIYTSGLWITNGNQSHFIGCWWFWSKIYSKTACISPHIIHQEKSPCGCRLDRLPVLWNQNRLEIWSEKERWSLHAKVCPQRPPWIPTTISKDTPTNTPQMGTPKLWIKNKMGQRGKFIRDPTRTEEKKIQKWWENFYIMDGQSTKRYECHS